VPLPAAAAGVAGAAAAAARRVTLVAPPLGAADAGLDRLRGLRVGDAVGATAPLGTFTAARLGGGAVSGRSAGAPADGGGGVDRPSAAVAATAAAAAVTAAALPAVFIASEEGGVEVVALALAAAAADRQVVWVRLAPPDAPVAAADAGVAAGADGTTASSFLFHADLAAAGAAADGAVAAGAAGAAAAEGGPRAAAVTHLRVACVEDVPAAVSAAGLVRSAEFWVSSRPVGLAGPVRDVLVAAGVDAARVLHAEYV